MRFDDGRKPARLTDAGGLRLVELARGVIEEALGVAAPPSPSPLDDQLRRPGDLFVTLRRLGRLRGCIGTVGRERMLIESVAECALGAAFRDPRFDPLREPDLAGLEVQVSVLSLFRTIRGPDEIEIGTHGLYVEQGEAHGLLLPQVALEFDRDAAGFLRMVCRKAELPEDAWQSGARVSVFTTRKFPGSGAA